MSEQQLNGISKETEYTGNISSFTRDGTDGRIPLYTGAWHAGDDGVYTIHKYKEHEETVYACVEPIRPIKILKNLQTDKETIEIAYGSRLKNRLVCAQSVLANPGKMVNMLPDYGVAVNTDNAKPLMQYIMTCITQNGELRLPRVKGTSKLGWLKNRHGEYVTMNGVKQFAPYCTTVKIDIPRDDGRWGYADMIMPKGSLDVWCKYVLEYRKKLPCRLALAASFAAPLLSLIGELPFIVHLYGMSGTGKSSVTKLVASTWGNGCADGGLVRSLETTETALLNALDLLNHIPFFGDELHGLKSKYEKYNRGGLDSLAYTITNGGGRERGTSEGGTRLTGNFRTVLITSGECTWVNDRSENGAKNRVIQINMDTQTISKDEGQSIDVFVQNTYGVAGKAYVEYLQTLSDEDIECYRETVRELAKALVSDYGCTDKQAGAAAIMLLADAISCNVLWSKYELPHDGEDGKDIHRLMPEDIAPYLLKKADMDKSGTAYSYLVEQITANQECFSTLSGYREKWGKYADSDKKYVYVMRGKLLDILRNGGFEFEAMQRIWENRGYYVPKSQQIKDKATGKVVRTVNRTCHMVSIGHSKTECFKIALPTDSDDSDS